MPGELHRFSHKAMDTEFELIVQCDKREYAAGAAQEAFSEIDRLEAKLSRFDATSEVGQINLLAAGQTMTVSVETMECLLTALWLNTETNGSFDITVGPLVDCFRGKDGVKVSPFQEMVDEAAARKGMSNLQLDPDTYTVGTVNGRLGIDLGGIGKGFALDKAVELLEDWEIPDLLIHGGTSTALGMGRPAGKLGWPVGVGGDWGEKAGITELLISNNALSGSGIERQADHVINPVVCQPVEEHLAAWALTPSAAVSDGLSTAFMVMSQEEIEKYCVSHSEVDAYIVKKDEKLIEIRRNEQ